MIKPKLARKHLYSPLRYPGGKASLTNFFQEVIKSQGWKKVTYVEPYAGGAGAALSLLLQGAVEKIVINDYDPAIYAFWKSVVEHPRAFINRINAVPLTIDEWLKQKEIYKKKNLKKTLELGFATFYLNRTNRSGVLDAGPIGGMNQAGKWKLDARFNRETLSERVRLIGANREKITVLKMDGVDVIQKYAQKNNSFFYIDPPYYKKGAMLYLNAFNHANHQELANVLNACAKANWLLSYDAVDEIKKMYIPQGRTAETFSLRYSVHQNTKSGSELMVFSDSIDRSLLYK